MTPRRWSHRPTSLYPPPPAFAAGRVSDPDPALFLIADPDPGFDDLKLKKIYSWIFNFYNLDQKLPFTYP
jgi:hypothetical protein